LGFVKHDRTIAYQGFETAYRYALRVDISFGSFPHLQFQHLRAAAEFNTIFWLETTSDVVVLTSLKHNQPALVHKGDCKYTQTHRYTRNLKHIISARVTLDELAAALELE
jgi:hypothetical protein